MSSHPHRLSDPSISPSPDIQGARTLASFLAQRTPSAYRESPRSHEFAARTQRTAQGYESRTAQPQGPPYPNPYPREFPPGNAGRHPSLSLDTRNLVPPSGRSPSPASVPAPLHADLTTLKTGLETLWTRSAHSLHTLHYALAAEREARHRTLREREMLAAANARMWEDKARLEGEKRELRARLDAQTAAADVRERAAENSNVSVKMEETDDEDNATVPMREVQRMIEERLQRQADEFARETTELYAKLAVAQSRATDLEAQFSQPRPAPTPPPASTSTSGPVAVPARPHSPMTPHTSRPSAHSETEFPFVRRRPGSSGDPPDVRSAAETVYTAHGGVPLQDSRAYAALRAHPPPPPGHSHMRTREAHAPRRPHPTPHPQPQPPYDPGSLRTMSLPNASPPMEPPSRRTASGPVDPQRVLPPAASYPPPRHPAPQQQAFRHHPPPQRLQNLQHRPPPPPPQSAQHMLHLPPPPPPHSRRPPSPSIPPPRGPSPPPRPAPNARPSSDPPAPIRPASPAAPPQPTPPVEHSRPGTPTPRPAKRARTAEPPPDEMTEDERRTLGALSSVLAKKRDGAGWKCVLCRQEKKNPTATFSETTPIGTVTEHVRGVHVVFWETLGSAPDPS